MSLTPMPGGRHSVTCEDCVPVLQVQGGDWGWTAHRFWLHGEGADPGPNPEYRQPAARPARETDRAASPRQG